VGTRIEDQPPEHWAGPESLDPTPVWKQFALIGAFLLIGLVLVIAVAGLSFATQLATPPALVFGDRLVLSTADVPAVGAAPRRVGAPLVPEDQALWLARTSPTDVVAFSAHWMRDSATDCPLTWSDKIAINAVTLPTYVASCPGSGADPVFTQNGAPMLNAARGLDRYLVSVTNDRVVVNLSRLIVSPERTSAPRTP
jgi:hypothetical protein